MDDSDEPLDPEEIQTRLIPVRLLVGVMVAGQVVLALGATWLLASGFGASPRPLRWWPHGTPPRQKEVTSFEIPWIHRAPSREIAPETAWSTVPLMRPASNSCRK